MTQIEEIIKNGRTYTIEISDVEDHKNSIIGEPTVIKGYSAKYKICNKKTYGDYIDLYSDDNNKITLFKNKLEAMEKFHTLFPAK